MDVGIALVAYNIKKNQIEILNTSLSNFNYKYLVVYDNSPFDSSRNLFVNSGWNYHWTGQNLGFGKAHNLLFEKYNHLSTFHLIINPDVSFNVDVVSNLIDFLMKVDDAGCVMPKILYPNGENQYLAKFLPSFFDLMLRRVPFEFIKKQVNERLEIRKLYDQSNPFRAPFLSGCFLIFKNEVIKKVGFFDERFFLYSEDLDLTRRFWISNNFPYCYPGQIVYHSHEKASAKNLYLFVIHLTSVVKYFFKWGFFDKNRKLINKKCYSQSL